MQEVEQASSGASVDTSEVRRAPVGAGVGEVSVRKAAFIAAFHAPVFAAGVLAYVELPHHAVGGFVSFILMAMGAGGVGFAVWQLLLWALDRLDSRRDRGTVIPD